VRRGNVPKTLETPPDIELESFLIWLTMPIWIWFFVALFVAGWVNDRKAGARG
jgi:hypothetical protein